MVLYRVVFEREQMDKSNLCVRCINWDHRPEGNQGERMGYCIARRKIVGPHLECEFYLLKTADRVASMNTKLYGSMDGMTEEDF